MIVYCVYQTLPEMTFYLEPRLFGNFDKMMTYLEGLRRGTAFVQVFHDGEVVSYITSLDIEENKKIWLNDLCDKIQEVVQLELF